MMKQYALVCSIAVGAFLTNPTSVSAQNMDNAGTYMDYFSTIYKPIQKDMWDYTNAVAKSKRPKKIDNKRQDLLSTLKAGESKAKRAKAWDGDVALRDEVVTWIQNSQITLNEEYGKIMDLSEIAEQSYDNMEAYIMAKELAGKHMSESNDALSAETKRFAAANKVTLIEEDSKLGKKLERANKAFEYYNDVFLIFFKSNKQEAYLTDAANKQDVNAIEQNKNTLLEYAEQGRVDLRAIKTYNGDGTLKLATDKALQFYIRVAKEDAQITLDYYLSKENFDKVKASFDAIKSSKRTKQDVDEYNQAINDFNAAVNKFNASNERLNKERSNMIDYWNKTAEKFLAKHAA